MDLTDALNHQLAPTLSMKKEKRGRIDLELITLIALIPLVLPLVLVGLVAYYIMKTVKGFERRADEKLALERENNTILKQQVEDLNKRVQSIESLLKENE